MMDSRHLYQSFFGSLVLDAILASMIAYFFEGSRGIAFIVTLVLLVVIPWILKLWALAKQWILFYVFFKERMIRTFLLEFSRSKLPKPDYQFDCFQYFDDTAKNKELPDEPRFYAAVVAGLLEGYKHVQPFGVFMMTTLAMEEAIHRYDRDLGGPPQFDV